MRAKHFAQEHNTMQGLAQTRTAQKFCNELKKIKLPWACSVAVPVTNGNKASEEI